MKFDFAFMLEAMKSGVKFMPTTLGLTVSSFAIGIVLGTAIAIIRLFHVRVLSPVFAVLVTVTKAVPVVLTQYLVYFIFTDAFNAVAEALHWSIRSKDISLVGIGITALSIVAVSTISETIRGAFLAVPAGQYDAAYSVGLTRSQALRRVIIPQMLPVAFPVLCANLIMLLKASSLVYLISITDLLNGTLLAATSNYAYLEAYVAAALMYWALCVIIELLFGRLNKSLHVARQAASQA